MIEKLKGLFRWTAFRVSFFLSLLLMAVYIANPPILDLFELKAYDFRLRWRGEIPTTGRIVIVGIDEKSLDEMGQWPWPRMVMAELVEALTRNGARVVGLDIIWPEPEQRVGILDALYGASGVLGQTQLVKSLQEQLARVAETSPQMDAFLREVSRGVLPDEILARAIRESDRVVLGDFFFMSRQEVPHLWDAPAPQTPVLLEQSEYPIVRKGRSLKGAPFIPRPFLVKGNIPVIGSSAKAFGFFNMVPDTDGVVRSVPVVMEYDGRYLLPLSLQTLRYAGDHSLWILELEEFGVAGIQWEHGWIPTTEMGFMFINYRGKDHTFPYLSAADVIRGRVQQEQIKDKIVLVGAVATGIFDLRVTPLASVFPGVEVHANIIDNILKGDFIVRPEWASLIDMLSLLILGIVFGWAFPRLRPVSGAVVMLAIFVANLYVNTIIMVDWGYWLNVIYPSLFIPMSYLGVSIYKYIHEEREKRKIKGAFQFYVTPAVVNQMLKDPNALKLGGEKKVLSVLFSDIRGFTSMSESLTPEGLVHLLNEYLTEMTNVVFQHDGTLDKYIGDAVMAIYGAPLPQEDHPLRACLSALDMMEELGKLRARWAVQGKPAIDIGIGVNTGEMVVGNMGSERRFDYTVIGDDVNLASRLEGLNKQYGTHIIISEFTYPFVRDHLWCRDLDVVRVKGKAKPVKILEVLGRRDGAPTDDAWTEIFADGLARYRELRWDDAVACFARVLEIRPEDGPTRVYLKRCDLLRTTPPPPDWDGAFDWQTK
jgi:adenylate cyclase